MLLLTKKVASVKISSHDASFMSNHFKFHFLQKTYSPVSEGICNLSAKRVFVWTAKSLIIFIIESLMFTMTFDMLLFFTPLL